MEDMNKQWAGEALAKCTQKYGWVAALHKDDIPYTTGPDGRYDNRAARDVDFNIDDGLNWWTNGFWGGIMWQMYRASGDKLFLEVANTCEGLLDECFADFYGLHHDVGFMWIPTAVTNYLLTGSLESRKRALHAANLLAGRFNLAGGFIRAWNDVPGLGSDTRGWAIIDCMLNIPLLYWATEETGDPRFKHIAMAHANTVMKTFMRPDGSVNHIVEFDPEVGGVVKTHGGQGYANGSAWTRGQAWALYGFATSYKMTKNTGYLTTARMSADYFISKVPEAGIIPIDFDQPTVPALEDSCAAAIAACGLLELSALDYNIEESSYRKTAIRILKALHEYRADYGNRSEAILTHCSGAYHSPASHHITMVYADYFYIEALQKLVESTDTGFIW